MKSPFRSIIAAAVLSVTATAADVREQPPKDLDGYFPFEPSETRQAWDKRAQAVREQLLVSLGLWPLPTRTPLKAQVYGKVEREEYTVEKVTFESMPGLWVTGSLYRPKPGVGAPPVEGKRPGVLCPHGHWNNGRFYETSEAEVKKAIAAGEELFEEGGRSPLQARAVGLARMGCTVFVYDMLGYADSVQLGMELVHKFGKTRPHMNGADGWGFFSPRAESWSQSLMGLQAWNSIRALDFLESLPEVDAKRLACTGASGGGTQTFILGAIDPRPATIFPAVMVSTAMQGGCTCENCSGLRIGTGNVEFAALFAPKPLAMTAANDWTKEMETKGFPQLKWHYGLMDAGDRVELTSLTQFGHNYNAPSRAAMYRWFNKHLGLNLPAEKIAERDYRRLTTAEMSVWDAGHPAPAGDAVGEAFEKKLLGWWKADAEAQLKAHPELAATGWRVVLGRSFAQAGEKFSWDGTTAQKTDRGDHTEMRGPVGNTTYGEEVATTFLYPKKWNGTAVLWLDGQDAPSEAAVACARAGNAVVLSRLFMPDAIQNRLVKNPRQAPAYTYGYNHPLFAQRVHDGLTLLKFVQTNEHYQPKALKIVGKGAAAPIAAAVRYLAGEAVKSADIEPTDFRFANVPDYRDAGFLPGGAKYGDVPALLGK